MLHVYHVAAGLHLSKYGIKDNAMLTHGLRPMESSTLVSIQGCGKDMMKKTYTLFWKTGQREIVHGYNPAEAMTLAGYGGGALGALDFYSSGDCKEYTYNKDERTWNKN